MKAKECGIRKVKRLSQGHIKKFWSRSIYNVSLNVSQTGTCKMLTTFQKCINVSSLRFYVQKLFICRIVKEKRKLYFTSMKLCTCISQIYNIYSLRSLKFIFICKITCLLCELSMLLLNNWNECLCRNPIILRLKGVTYCPKDRQVIRTKMLHFLRQATEVALGGEKMPFAP